MLMRLGMGLFSFIVFIIPLVGLFTLEPYVCLALRNFVRLFLWISSLQFIWSLYIYLKIFSPPEIRGFAGDNKHSRKRISWALESYFSNSLLMSLFSLWHSTLISTVPSILRWRLSHLLLQQNKISSLCQSMKDIVSCLCMIGKGPISYTDFLSIPLFLAPSLTPTFCSNCCLKNLFFPWS